jgi:hypothetical protein
MAEKQLSFFDYVKEAFFWKTRVPLLGYLPFNIYGLVGIGVLSLVHPGFLLLGAAIEAGYLIFVPGDKRFQKVIQGRQLLDIQDTWKKKRDNILTKLDLKSQTRYQVLNEMCLSLVKSGDSDNLSTGLHEYGLNQLMWTFLQLLGSREKVAWMLRTTSVDSIQKEIRDLEAKLATEQPGTPLHSSHTSTLEISRKRLENIERAKADLEILDAELVRIEQRFALFREESALATSSQAFSSRLDGVMQSLQETSSWLDTHKELLSDSVDTIPSEIFTLHDQPVKE